MNDFINAGDISAVGDNGSIYARENTEIRIPKEYSEDKYVAIRSSELRKVRSRLRKELEAGETIPWADIMLAFVTMPLGYLVSSLLTGTELGSCQGIFSYCICPALTVALFFGCLLIKKSESRNSKNLADYVLDHLVEDRDPMEMSNYEH
ncbi:hypothetical protein ACULPM_04020 [Thermophilibacter sp. ZX-H3]|uniref:hypothetical protein n=1 Tax=unclassified Thermophilibacter TaxID=2847308 RepID=UPI0040407ADD